MKLLKKVKSKIIKPRIEEDKTNRIKSHCIRLFYLTFQLHQCICYFFKEVNLHVLDDCNNKPNIFLSGNLSIFTIPDNMSKSRHISLFS